MQNSSQQKSVDGKSLLDKLEKLAETIDPPGREISDAELIDPGANIPDDDSTSGKREKK